MTLLESSLVQILLPLRDNSGRKFRDDVWEQLKGKLVEQFGGLTAYTRAPAEGVWAPSPDKETAEDIFVVEVMCRPFDEGWWEALQAELESTLRQERVVIRVLALKELSHSPRR